MRCKIRDTWVIWVIEEERLRSFWRDQADNLVLFAVLNSRMMGNS